MMKNTKLLMMLFACVAMGIVSCNKADDLAPMPDTSAKEPIEFSANKNSGSINKLVAQVRQATDKYHDFQVALDDGFFNTHDCVAIPGVGGMGVHFVHFGRVDDVHDPLEPEVLVYELKNNGEYKLVAVEYLHVGSTAPMFGGEVMFHPFPLPDADYALHVWVWKANPAGLFEDWNPNITCP